MNDSFANKVAEASNDLFNNISCSELINLIFLEILRKIHFAFLHDHEKRVILFYNVIEFDNMRMVKLLQDGSLILDCIEDMFVSRNGEFLDGIWRRMIDFSKGALTNNRLKNIFLFSLPYGPHRFSKINTTL